MWWLQWQVVSAVMGQWRRQRVGMFMPCRVICLALLQSILSKRLLVCAGWGWVGSAWLHALE